MYSTSLADFFTVEIKFLVLVELIISCNSLFVVLSIPLKSENPLHLILYTTLLD